MQKRIPVRLNANDWFILFSTMIILIIPSFASDSYTPSLPAMTRAFRTSSDAIQLTMTFYLLGVSCSQLFWGPISDRYGRRPIILFGVVIAGIGSFLCAVAPTLIFILFVRLVQGVGAGVCNSLFRAILRDSFTGNKLAQAGSYAGMFFTIIFAIAPILGGYIEEAYGWRANFIFVGLLIITIFLMLLKFLKESHRQPDIYATRLRNVFKNYWSMLTSPMFVGYTLVSSLAFSGFITYYTAAPFIMENVVGLTPVEFGWLSLGMGAGLFAGSLINAQLLVHSDIAKILFAGTVVMFLSGVVMLGFGLGGVINTWVIILPTILFTTASGLVFANANAYAFHHFGHIAGTAGGMFGFIQIFGSAMVTIIVSKMHERTQIPLASILAALGLVALLLVLFLPKIAEEA